MKNLFSLDGKVIIVTGGSGYLGSRICIALAESGAIVYALGRDQEKLSRLIHSRIIPISLDVINEKRFEEFIATVFEKHGHIDGLVNNASSAKREKWQDLDREKWNEGFDGALTHYFSCTKVVSKYFLQQKSGVVVNNASLFSFLAPCFPMHLDLGNAAAAHHAAAKGGVIQLTKYLAALWGKDGIRVNSISPGYFPQKRGVERLDYMNEMTTRIPMGRIGNPTEVAGSVVFLLSNASSYITGHNLIIDGGYSIW
jgi:NAD(P)-dependent dehydrogenase (short-subunit alcohol dehydrogenase family)